MEVVGIIEHDPRQGTLFAGCTLRKLGLAAFAVELENAEDILMARALWPTHSLMVVKPTGAPENVRHVVTYGPNGKPHVSPSCPFVAKVLSRGKI